MKKIFSSLAVLAILFTAVACNKATDTGKQITIHYFDSNNTAQKYSINLSDFKDDYGVGSVTVEELYKHANDVVTVTKDSTKTAYSPNGKLARANSSDSTYSIDSDTGFTDATSEFNTISDDGTKASNIKGGSHYFLLYSQAEPKATCDTKGTVKVTTTAWTSATEATVTLKGGTINLSSDKVLTATVKKADGTTITNLVVKATATSDATTKTALTTFKIKFENNSPTFAGLTAGDKGTISIQIATSDITATTADGYKALSNDINLVVADYEVTTAQ